MARGRLFHSVRLDKLDRIADYAFVAPTEWNFHDDRPLAATLRDATLGDAPRLEVQRLASVFDPCVAFEVELKETADA